MNEIRTVACIGDSITFAPSMAIFGVTEPWVDQLTAALERTARPRRGDGFRGLWRDDEWAQSGSWTQPETADPFDVAPFRRGLYSSGCAADELVWIKPATLTVHAFDILGDPVRSLRRSSSPARSQKQCRSRRAARWAGSCR